MDVGISGDALHVAERLLQRLPERDADILGGVVVIDMQVALGLDREVDAGMARQKLEHVVEEADAGRDRRNAGAVEIDRNLDVGLLGAALDRTFAHERIFRLEPRALYQGSTAFATLAATAIAPLSDKAYIIARTGSTHAAHRFRPLARHYHPHRPQGRQRRDRRRRAGFD